MLGLDALVARSTFLTVLSVYFFFTSAIPLLHKCFPLAEGNRGWEHPGASAFHEKWNYPPAPRADVDHSTAFDEEQACVACLFSSRLRGLSPPAGVSAPVLAKTQRIPHFAVGIPALSEIWIRILPRAPPATALS